MLKAIFSLQHSTHAQYLLCARAVLVIKDTDELSGQGS